MCESPAVATRFVGASRTVGVAANTVPNESKIILILRRNVNSFLNDVLCLFNLINPFNLNLSLHHVINKVPTSLNTLFDLSVFPLTKQCILQENTLL